MHSISGSSIVGKYDRVLTYTLKPARAKRWIVASCREPFGMPSFSFISRTALHHRGHRGHGGASEYLSPCPPCPPWFLGFRQRPKKACSLACVTDISIAESPHLHQHRVVIAIDEDVDDLELVA